MNQSSTQQHDPKAAESLIDTRRTIHSFLPDLPPQELVDRALALACQAPNHHLSEPWRFYMLGPETREAIAQLNAGIVERSRGSAAARQKLARWRAVPGWMMVTCKRSDDEQRQREDYAACCCAIQNFSLYLWSAGIGVKWTTGDVIRDPEFFDLVWLDPQAESVVGLVWYGYPAEIPVTSRKPLTQVRVQLP